MGPGALLPAFPPTLGSGGWLLVKLDGEQSTCCHQWHLPWSQEPNRWLFQTLLHMPPWAHSGTPLPLGCLMKSPNNPNPGHHAFPKLLTTKSIAPRSPRTKPGPPQQSLHFTQVSPSQGCFPEPWHCSKSWACSSLCLTEASLCPIHPASGPEAPGKDSMARVALAGVGRRPVLLPG